MRKSALVLSIAVVLCCLSACHKVNYEGQTGKILHKKYNPALNINYIMDDVEQHWDTIKLDLDRDNATDIKICFFYDKTYIIGSSDWELSLTTDGDISGVNWWSRDYQLLWGHLSTISIRHTTDEGPCYGWMDCYSTLGSEGQVNAIRFYLCETAYCTCPNYPLKWGEK